MRKIIILFVFVLAGGLVGAQVPDSTKSVSSRAPRVGLVLGGGGAKGAAHIGVLKYMEEIGIPISYVAGTSMGSIIGGLYAMGYPPDELAELIANMDWSFYMSNTIDRENLSSEQREYRNAELLSIPFDLGDMRASNQSIISSLPSGAVNSSNLLNLFNRLCIGYQDSMSFNDMPIPYACVATDLLTGDSVILNKGEFAKAIRSSMSIPGVFAPVEWDNRLLADGGMVNNFPVDVCMNMGADIIIGCEVASKPISDKDSLQSLPQQVMQYLSIATQGNNIENRKKCRIYIVPDVTGYNMLSFSTENIHDLVQRGYEQAKLHREEFLALKAELEHYGACKTQLRHPRARKLMPGQLIQLGEITYHGAPPSEIRRLLKLQFFEEGAVTDVNGLETAVSRLRGSSNYLYVHYKLHPADSSKRIDTKGLTVADNGKESYECYNVDVYLIPAKPHAVGLGFRFDSEESAALLFHMGFNEQRVAGFKAFLDLKLAYNFSVSTRFTWTKSGLGEVDFDYRYRKISFRAINLAPNNLWNNQFRLYYKNRAVNNLTLTAGFLEDNYIDADVYLNSKAYRDLFGDDEPSNYQQQWISRLFADIRYDNMDDNFFARRGMDFNVHAQLYKVTRILFNHEMKPDASILLSWKSHFSVSERFTLIPYLAGRALFENTEDYARALWNQHFVGGAYAGRYLDQQLPFFGCNHVFWAPETYAQNTNIGLARLDLRYQLTKKDYVSLVVNGYVAYSRNVEIGDYEPTGEVDEDGDPIEVFVSNPNGFYRDQNFGIGVRLAHKSTFGPIFLDLAWNTRTHTVSGFFNVGYYF